MEIIKGKGFVLRVTQAQEADVFVRILTQAGEKLTGFAKAGLKSKKRFGGSLQPFLNVEFVIRKSNDSGILQELKVCHEFRNLADRLEPMAAASYVTELVEHCAQEGLPVDHLYDLYGSFLRTLNNLNCDPFGLIRQFEIKLLSLLGWLPEINFCSACGAENALLSLNPLEGKVICDDCGSYSVGLDFDTQEAVGSMLTQQFSDSKFSHQHFRLLKPLVHGLIGAHLGKSEFKSLNFLNSIDLR